ncbi:MAG TPA: MCP four helix bundle domain-containing protein, partial [Gallionella sp.]|nr:MCP four helix bundle domain-containing protein [Gallionella sp.]
MLNNLKISTRLLFLLASLLVLAMVTGGLGLYDSSQANSTLESMYGGNLIPLEQLGVINERALHNRMAITNATVYPEKTEKYRKEVEDNIALISKNMDEYMATDQSPEEKRLAEKMLAARKRYVAEAVKPAMELMQKGDTAQLKLHLEKVRTMYYELKPLLEQLIELQKREAKKSYVESEASFKTMRMVSIGLILLGAALGGALGYSIIRGVNRSVDELRGVMVKMSADGDLNTRAKVYGQDEIA